MPESRELLSIQEHATEEYWLAEFRRRNLAAIAIFNGSQDPGSVQVVDAIRYADEAGRSLQEVRSAALGVQETAAV